VVVPVGFGTTVAQWAVGYLSHLPLVPFPRVALGILVLIQILGGRAAARRHPRRLAAGLGVGALCAYLNLLVFGSILAEPAGEAALGEPAGASRPGLAMGLSILLFLALGTLTGALGALTIRRGEARSFDGVPAFTRVAAVATLILVLLGGIVTSSEAGLAVPDWPTSFEANMFLLPLSKMVSESGVYYEHAHRLFGALVGFTVGALALYLWRFEPERRLRAGAAIAFVAVALQGALGGIRVEAAEAGLDNALSSALRVVHGISGQLLLAGLFALAAAASPGYRAATPLPVPTARGERRLAVLLLLASIGQLLLGALLRHISRDWLVPHIAGAVAVGGIAILASVRATGLYPGCPPLRVGGVLLMLLVVLQWLLGFLALAVTGPAPRSAATGALEILVATAHQGTGALLLAAATVHLLHVRRHLVPGNAAGVPGIANPSSVDGGTAGVAAGEAPVTHVANTARKSGQSESV